MESLSDEEILDGIALGDEESVGLLYDRYGRAAYSLAYRILNDVHAAEDVVQEAFLNVWRMAGSFNASRGSARSWLLSVVHHKAIDIIRKNRARIPTIPDRDYMHPVTQADEVWRNVVNNLDRETIQKALTQLSGEQREAIEMAYFSGYTHKQISELQGVPLGTAKGRIRNGMQKLRSHLMGQGAGV